MVKIESAHGHTPKQCYEGVTYANGGTGCVTDLPRSGRPSVNEEQVQAIATLLDIDRRQTIHELGQEIGLSYTTVLHILKNRLEMRKIVWRWVPYNLTEM
ncbi:hypothetical protein Trydic_g7461 [Trypoxylus dichotomus]